jgi:hypothetical protein
MNESALGQRLLAFSVLVRSRECRQARITAAVCKRHYDVIALITLYKTNNQPRTALGLDFKFGRNRIVVIKFDRLSDIL